MQKNRPSHQQPVTARLCACNRAVKICLKRRKLHLCANFPFLSDILQVIFGAFAKLRKRLHVCPSVWNSSAPTGRIFMKFHLRISRESVEKIQVSLKSNRSNVHFTWRLLTTVCLWLYLAEICLEWEIFQTPVAEKLKTHVLCPVTFSRKSCLLWDNVEKCQIQTGHRRQCNMAHSLCVLDT